MTTQKFKAIQYLPYTTHLSLNGVKSLCGKDLRENGLERYDTNIACKSCKIKAGVSKGSLHQSLFMKKAGNKASLYIWGKFQEDITLGVEE